MAGWTNKGKYLALSRLFVGGTIPTNYYVALCRSTAAPGADTNTLSELTQISTSTGYTSGGTSLTPGGTDFDVLTEDDTNDRGLVQIKDLTWTASGGDLDSGAGARYAVLTDDNGTEGSRTVEQYWDLSSDRNVSDGQTLTLQDCEIRINET